MKGKTEIYEDLTDISDSMLLESGTQIAAYNDPENDIYLSLEVRGVVRVTYKDETYRGAANFPEGLKKLISEGYTEYDENNVPNLLPWSYSPDVCVDMNNWFEVFEYTSDGEWTGISDVADCENYTKEDIESLFEDFAAELLKNRELERLERDDR